MSQYLDNMKIGDTIDFRGPNGLLVYKGTGTVTRRWESKRGDIGYFQRCFIKLDNCTESFSLKVGNRKNRLTRS